MKTIKNVMLIVIIFCFSFQLTGCHTFLAADYSFDENPEEATVDIADKTIIRIQTRYADHDATTPFFKTIQQEFMSENEDIKIIDESINEELAYNNKLKLDIASGNIPDMFQIIGHANLLPYALSGMILNIEPLLQDNPEWAAGFHEKSFRTWTFNEIDGIYGVPFSEGPEIMFYNKELFNKAGISEVPQSWQDLLDCIDALYEADIIPWGVGGKETWRVGHIHNIIMHRWNGVEKSKAIGDREAKWTDPEVVQTFRFLKDLHERHAFNRNLTKTTYLEEKTDFFAERTAMVFNGTWFIGEVKDSDIADKIGVFMFPYFKEKPQYKGDYTVFLSGHQLNGRMNEIEKEAMFDFIKYMTSLVVQEKMVQQIGRTPARQDININSLEIFPLVADSIGFYQHIEVYGDDTFIYDPLSSMQDVTRNAIVSLFLGNSPENVALEIQTEIDQNTDFE